MFTQKHYVPILKSKASEKWAISNLHANTAITPLFEIINIPIRNGQPTRTLPNHIANQLQALVDDWGTTRPFFLDTKWMHPRHGDPAITTAVFDSARQMQLQAIPVVYLDYNAATL